MLLALLAVQTSQGSVYQTTVHSFLLTSPSNGSALFVLPHTSPITFTDFFFPLKLFY